jgi:chorismate mutase
VKDIKRVFDIGATDPLYIAGPCSAESREQVLAAARGVHSAGVDIFRAGVWKPRTKPGSFEGMGSEALAWLAEVKHTYGMKVVTEVATAEHLEQALKAGVDGVWIGARTTTNPFATQLIADALQGVDIAVFVKNPVIPDVDLWLGSIERIYNSGIREIAAVHRGFGTHNNSHYRNDPHWSVPIELHRRLPNIDILCDPSHIGGRRELIAPLSQEALDLGFAGLMVECHPSPDTALSDAQQQVTPELLGEILLSLKHRSPNAEGDALGEFRQHIDSIDSRIVELLAERMEVARNIGNYKSQRGITIVQHNRYNELLQIAERRGEAMGLSKGFVHRIFSTIHEESVKSQVAIFEEKNHK